MAAIDKLYVHTYYEYDDLRRWAIVYYPELLFYFYNITITSQSWENDVKRDVKNSLQIAKRNYKKLGHFKNENEAVINRKKDYEAKGLDIPLYAITESVHYIIKYYNYTAEDWEQSYSCPIMSTPFEIDKKLLWICPVPCVRKYLEEICGYKTRWYHKLFFRGKKHFKY